MTIFFVVLTALFALGLITEKDEESKQYLTLAFFVSVIAVIVFGFGG